MDSETMAAAGVYLREGSPAGGIGAKGRLSAGTSDNIADDAGPGRHGPHHADERAPGQRSASSGRCATSAAGSTSSAARAFSHSAKS